MSWPVEKSGVPEMIEYKNSTFNSLFDRGEALLIENMRFEECTFINCGLSLTKSIDRRSVIRNVDLKNCACNGCGVGPAVFENVNIDGLKTNDLLIIWGATFNHVKLSGKLGKIKINPYVHHVDRTEATQGPFTEHRTSLYNSIDWALDISEARFAEFDARGIPARLFRRDSETQVVVSRERALTPGWRQGISSFNTLWPFMIDLFLSDGTEDTILVAPLSAPKKKRDDLLRGLKELRDLGVAEPD
jgi:hypothetical protein